MHKTTLTPRIPPDDSAATPRDDNTNSPNNNNNNNNINNNNNLFCSRCYRVENVVAPQQKHVSTNHIVSSSTSSLLCHGGFDVDEESNNSHSNNNERSLGVFHSMKSSGAPQLSLFDVAGSMLQKEAEKNNLGLDFTADSYSNNTNNALSHPSSLSTATTTVPSSSVPLKSVKFGALVIHEHKLTIGDMPWTDGPPVALSWEQVGLHHFDLDVYEAYRIPHRRQRRKDVDLKVSAQERRLMLKESGGYTEWDLIQAERLKKAISTPTSRSSRRHQSSMSTRSSIG